MTAATGSAVEGRASRLRRATPVILGLLVVAVVVVVLGPSGRGPALDPSSAGPDGLLGLVTVLEELGGEVTVGLDPPADHDTVAFVPLDLLNEERRDALTDWVRDGGTLVVAGVTPFHDRQDLGTSLGESLAPSSRTADCALPALEIVDEVRHDDWVALEAAQDDGGCFPSTDGGQWLLHTELGTGRLIMLGSATPFTNHWLSTADNAVLATSLFAPQPGDVVRIVPRPPADEREVGLLDLVAPGVWRLLVLATIAAVIAVIAHGRRLGPPVVERLPPVLPSGELARSLAGLTARAGDRSGAAARLRRHARHRVTQLLGLPTRTDPQVLVERLLAVTTIPRDDALTALLDRPVGDDDALVEVARAVSAVVRQLDQPTAPDTSGHSPAGPAPSTPSSEEP